MITYTGTYTDLYELTMAQVYLQAGRHDDPAVFDYFFRSLPFDGGYAVFAGLETLLSTLEELRFDDKDLAYLKDRGFPDEFLSYLKDFRFRGSIWSAREGDLVFPTRPVLQVEGTLIEAQIVETLLLNILNFQTLIATKAARMHQVAGESTLVDFGLRRAQGPAGYYAARAAVIGGFEGTSNVTAARDFGMDSSGTMAHSFIQSYEDELEAFRDYARYRPDDCVLLVDTYDTLKSGLPNAITVGKELHERGHQLKAIRLDSGDLAYLAKESRRMLDEAGLGDVKIAASNQLDEHVIKSLKEQNAPIDLFGVGTSLVIGRPDGALDGVYKLASYRHEPRIKLSESTEKITIPGKKQVYRITDTDGKWIGAEVITLRDESKPDIMHDPKDQNRSLSLEGTSMSPLLSEVMRDGKRTESGRSLKEIAAYSRQQRSQLPDEYKRFDNPHTYKIGMGPALTELRNTLVTEHKENKK